MDNGSDIGKSLNVKVTKWRCNSFLAQNAKGMFKSNKMTSQQVNCENDVVRLTGPPTEAEVKVNNKIVNS